MSDDLEPYLAAIRAYAPAHAGVTAAAHWWTDIDGRRALYVEDPPRDHVALGDVYVTFRLEVDRELGSVARITYYRSRKGANGDDTLPP
ncbi:MAG: hypothetical protein ACM31C_25460 [Acidobacteriota bacterium]